MKHAHLLPLLLFLPACASPVYIDAVSSPTIDTLWTEESEGVLTVRFGDELFATYHYGADPRPYIYPLHGPGDIPVTRGYPMEERPDEASDHSHHQSLWFSHGNVNGVDFWHGGAKRPGKIVYTGRLKEILNRKKLLRVTMEFAWKDPEGKTLLTERRRTTFGADDDVQRWIDFDIALTATNGDVTFGDTKEGSLAMRMHPELRLKGEVATGSATNSEGVRDKKVWGKRAAWVHYQGTVGEKPMGVGIFEHPENFRHPTWWHARDYGLVAANPFGIHDFEGKPAGTGDHTIKKGETLRLRYRVWIHPEKRTQKEVAKAFEVYLVHSREE